jgi:hypothetical protein
VVVASAELANCGGLGRPPMIRCVVGPLALVAWRFLPLVYGADVAHSCAHDAAGAAAGGDCRP